jgi:hypothetical protein
MRVLQLSKSPDISSSLRSWERVGIIVLYNNLSSFFMKNQILSARCCAARKSVFSMLVSAMFVLAGTVDAEVRAMDQGVEKSAVEYLTDRGETSSKQ